MGKRRALSIVFVLLEGPDILLANPEIVASIFRAARSPRPCAETPPVGSSDIRFLVSGTRRRHIGRKARKKLGPRALVRAIAAPENSFGGAALVADAVAFYAI